MTNFNGILECSQCLRFLINIWPCCFRFRSHFRKIKTTFQPKNSPKTSPASQRTTTRRKRCRTRRRSRAIKTILMMTVTSPTRNTRADHRRNSSSTSTTTSTSTRNSQSKPASMRYSRRSPQVKIRKGIQFFEVPQPLSTKLLKPSPECGATRVHVIKSETNRTAIFGLFN